LQITPASGAATNVSVNWGDGTTQDLGVVASARTVTHVYSNPGVYPITVSASGPDGESFSTAATATVAARPAPTITVTPTTPGTTATTFTFTVTAAANTNPRNLRVEFGDGDATELGATTTGFVTHRYTSPGTYVARVIQTDSAGGTSAASVAVTVN
jgi:PKD repeat protein